VSEGYEIYVPILNSINGFEVQPFEQEGRKFGGVKILKARLREENVGIVIPERTHYENVLEIISTEHLRAKYGLKDGDKIKVVIPKNQGTDNL
jgi:riboflavin kinase